MNRPSASPGDCPFQQDPVSQTLVETVTEHDLDRAIALGLLTFEPASHRCDRCRDAVEGLVVARDARLRALAARERYRARQTRLAERAEARARKRASPAPASSTTAPSLPASAAAALARAKARVAAKRPSE